jgi:predicted nucleic acid-binding protein
MKDYILDANSVLRYFDPRNANDELVHSVFLQAQRDEARLFMSVINAGEVFYLLIRDAGELHALNSMRILQNLIAIVEADLERTMEAARLKHRYKLGYADSFAASLALSLKATLVSADPDFEKLGKSLKWMRLPRFIAKGR